MPIVKTSQRYISWPNIGVSRVALGWHCARKKTPVGESIESWAVDDLPANCPSQDGRHYGRYCLPYWRVRSIEDAGPKPGSTVRRTQTTQVGMQACDAVPSLDGDEIERLKKKDETRSNVAWVLPLLESGSDSVRSVSGQPRLSTASTHSEGGTTSADGDGRANISHADPRWIAMMPCVVLLPTSTRSCGKLSRQP